MNKKYLFGLAVLLGMILTPKAVVAATGSLVISELQTQSAASKTEEFVELYNPSTAPLVVTGWTVEYRTAGNNLATPLIATLQGSIKPGGFVLLSKTGYVSQADGYFSVGLSETGGHVRIVDSQGQEVDRLGWGAAALPEGSAAAVVDKGFTLRREANAAALFNDTNNNAQDFIAGIPDPKSGGVVSSPNPDTTSPSPEPTPIPTPVCDGIEINEIMPNPAGADAAGGEFVELRNTTDQTVDLMGCTLTTDKVHNLTFAAGTNVAANGYYKVALADKLLNASGTVTLTSAANEHVVQYPLLNEDTAWALINGKWQITAKATPGTVNQLLLGTIPGKGGVVLAPCPAGKFRNPATNRCKNRISAASSLTPCKPGTVRNPLTNRCRSVVLATATLTPCKVGQTRNPATNRCRKIVLASVSLVPCRDGYERNPDTNRCRKQLQAVASHTPTSTTQGGTSTGFNWGIIAVIGSLVAGYCIYEYRRDIAHLYTKLRGGFTTGQK